MKFDLEGLKHKKLIVALAFLCFVILVLVITITVVTLNSHEVDEELEPEEQGEWTGLEAEISMVESVGEAVGIYQLYIDAAETEEEKINIYNQRIDYILQNDDEGAYSEQAVKDSIKIYELEPSVSTAVQAANVAEDLGDKETAKKYNKIADEKTLEEGGEPEGELNG